LPPLQFFPERIEGAAKSAAPAAAVPLRKLRLDLDSIIQSGICLPGRSDFALQICRGVIIYSPGTGTIKRTPPGPSFFIPLAPVPFSIHPPVPFQIPSDPV